PPFPTRRSSDLGMVGHGLDPGRVAVDAQHRVARLEQGPGHAGPEAAQADQGELPRRHLGTPPMRPPNRWAGVPQDSGTTAAGGGWPGRRPGSTAPPARRTWPGPAAGGLALPGRPGPTWSGPPCPAPTSPGTAPAGTRRPPAAAAP